MRIRLVELALAHAEEDLQYKLGRGYTLPRGLSYRGGVSGGKQPVPLNALRQLVAAKEALGRQAALEAAPGPWRSKREAAGMSTRSKIEELSSARDVEEAERRASAPLLKKGFLNSTKGQIYPNGSDEGMLYGDIKTAGDPLGYIPKGLRSRVNVVDTGAMPADRQKQMMEAYADGKHVQRPNSGEAPAVAKKAPACGGSEMHKGFLNGTGGSLYPDGSPEGKPVNEMDVLKELVPSNAELERLAAETDPNDFLKELSAFGSVLGLDGAADAPRSREAPSNPVRSHLVSEQTSPLPPGATEATPEHELTDAGAEASMVLRVKLPDLDSLGDTDVDVSEETFALHAPGKYRLELRFPRPIDADEAKAKFIRKSHTLQVTLPPLQR